MNITTVHPYSDLQDVIRPESGKNSSQENRRDHSNLVEVNDPPFFPIATYQRMDLIQKSGNSGEDKIRQSEADHGINRTVEVTRGNPVSAPENIRPGTILTVKA
jgi:hypothetical protein